MYETTLVIGRERFIPLPAMDAPRLVQSLDETGFDFQAAFWLYQSDIDDWRLYIATPLVKKIGQRETYQKVQEILSHQQPPLDITLSYITVVNLDEPVVRVLRKSYHVEAGHPAVFVRRSILDGVVVEEALIYRMV